MRNVVTISTGFIVLAVVAACETGPGRAKEPPALTITSPVRSLIQGAAGKLAVTGSAQPSPEGDAVAKVMVNDVQATLQPDGSFSAMVDIPAGATLIQTVATDVNGISATDTRAVQAGRLHAVGTNIERAVAAAISANGFAKLSAAAGPILKGLDLTAMLRPLQPMLSLGGSLANLKLSVDNVKFSDVKISLVPVAGGLSFRAEIDKLDVPAHIDYAGTLVPDGTTTIRVTADKIVVAGTLHIAPNGMAGFKTTLGSPDVQITNPDLSASGLPGLILDLLDVNKVLTTVVPPVAELAMGPLVNLALGALAGPKQIDLLGKKLDMQVSPAMVDFTADGGVVEMNMKAMLEGSEQSPGFIYTDNGTPSLDRVYGLQIGLADDLANEMLAEMHALGMLNLSMPQNAGVFDTAQIQLTMPPMISADAADGEMRVVLGDMFATFTSHGTPVGKAAINARIDLRIAPLAGGSAVALQLGTPEIHVNTLDDVANTTGLADKDLAAATGAVLGAQIDAITKLLVAIPIPSIAGLQFHDLSISADDGYVMVSGQLQ
jgi:Glucodextranase, domain B